MSRGGPPGKPEKSRLIIPNPQATAHWPDLPFYERDPTQVCATCRFLVRLRASDGDMEGSFTCKAIPPTPTSMVLQTGQIGAISANFCPQLPTQWCFMWHPRDENQQVESGALSS